MENSKTEPVVDKASSLSVNFEKFESLGLEVMIFFCNVKAKELLPKYCGTQGMMNAAKNTELGKKFVNEFLECCQEINAQKKKKVDIKQEVDSSLADNMTLDMSVEEVVNEAVITRIKEEEFSEASESVITEKDAEPSGKVNEYMWSQMLSNFVHMVGEYENTKRDENLSGTGSMSANKGETDTEPKDEHCGVKIKTEPIDPDDEVIPQTNQNPVGMDYWNAQTAMSGESRVSTSSVMTTPTLVKQLQNNFVSGLQNISIPNTHAVTGSSVSVGTPVDATDTGGIATVMPGSKQNALSLKMIGNKLYFVLPCNMNVPLQPVSPNTSVTQAVQITPVQNVSVNTGAPANAFISPQTIDVPEPAVNTSVQNVVLSKVGLHASKTLQTVVTSNIGLAANTQVPMINALPGPAANTTNVGLAAHSIFSAQNLVAPQTTGQRSGRMSPPCVEPSAKRQKMDSNDSVSPQISNSNQHALSKIDSNPGFSVTNTSAVYGDGMPRVASTTTAKSLQKNDTKSTSPVPCSSKTSMSLRRGASFDGGPTSADEQVCDEDDDNVDDDENKDDDEGGTENTTGSVVKLENDISEVDIKNFVTSELNDNQNPRQDPTSKRNEHKSNTDMKLSRSTLERNNVSTESHASQQTKTLTLRQNYTGLNLVKSYLKSNGELRPIKAIPVTELNHILCDLFLNGRNVNGYYYKPKTLRVIMLSIDQYLDQINYGFSVKHSAEFFQVRMAYNEKLKIKESEAVNADEIEVLWERQEFGTRSPDSLIASLCFFNCVHFGLRRAMNHRSLKWGDVKLCCDDSGIEYLEYTKRQTRKGPEETKKMFANTEEPNRCPVNIYKVYASKRPDGYNSDNYPFYLTSVNKGSELNWFKRQPLGVHKLALILKRVSRFAGIDLMELWF